MRNIFLLIVLMLILLVINNLFSQNNAQADVLPEWFGQITDDDYFYGFGQAESANYRATVSRATAFAIAEASISVEAHLQRLIDFFIADLGIDDEEVIEQINDVLRIVSNQRFSGAKVINSQVTDLVDGNFKALIQYSIPKIEVNSHLINEFSYDEKLYDLIKKSRTFTEIENELK